LEFICHLFIVIWNLCQKKQQFKKCDTMEDLIVKRRETANEATASALAGKAISKKTAAGGDAGSG
jgi:hypothetical protein